MSEGLQCITVSCVSHLIVLEFGSNTHDLIASNRPFIYVTSKYKGRIVTALFWLYLFRSPKICWLTAEVHRIVDPKFTLCSSVIVNAGQLYFRKCLALIYFATVSLAVMAFYWLLQLNSISFYWFNLDTIYFIARIVFVFIGQGIGFPDFSGFYFWKKFA